MTDQPELKVEKWVWTDADFERMGWHDVQLHGLARYEKVDRDEAGVEGHFGWAELLLDIDYILKWLTSEGSNRYFTGEFWLSPSTLAFEKVMDFQMEWVGDRLNWEISEITRKRDHYPNGNACWKWEIYGTGMTFLASGYKQFIRRKPVLKKFQSLTYEERGGVSFSKQAEDDTPSN